MRKAAFALAMVSFTAPAGCKARQEASEGKSLIAVDNQGAIEIMYQPLDRPRLDDANAVNISGNNLITRNVTEAATTADRPTPDFGAPNHLCFATCKSQPDLTGGAGRLAAIDCEPTGYANVDDVISAAGKMSEAAQERVLQALSTSQVLTSASDAGYKEAKEGLASLIRSDSKTKEICSGAQEGGGLSLTGDLFLSPICFRNKTGSTVRVDATVKYKLNGYKYLEERTAYWTYSPGENSCLNANGCSKNDDGLCKMAAIKYVASINGSSFQNNGAGVEFRSSRYPTDELWIDLRGGSSGSSSGSGSGSSSSSSSDSDRACLDALKEVYNNYGSGAFQSARTTEVTNCLNATLKTDWDNFRAHFYCQFPGTPVRQCFTYGAAALKQQGYSQSNAYKAMFQTCKTNGSFNSFTGMMMTNFEIVMTGTHGCRESPINSFYNWVGVNRPVR
jgi:hypothetical protein